MRLAAAAIWHETLSFAHTRTELAGFEAFQLTEGAEVIARNKEVRNEMGGFLAGAEQIGASLDPLLFAGALPSPTVSRAAYAAIRDRLIARLRACNAVDGFLFALHGAMAVDGIADPERDLLRLVRETLGPGVPLVATLDLHANVSEDLFREADVLIAYDTYPHVDVFDRGVEAVTIARSLVNGLRPKRTFRKLPLLTVPQAQATAQEPMRSIMTRVSEWEQDERVLAIAICPGYPYSEAPRLGFSIAVYTIDDQALADSIATDLATLVWSRRAEFTIQNQSPSDAVRSAIASGATPVILVDAADNIGGGAPGDGTAILRELLHQKAQGAVVTIADPESVAACFDAGVGADVTLMAGAKYDRNHGEPVPLDARVRLLSDGRYTHSGSYMTGMRVDMGRTAVVAAGGVDVVLMERKAMPFDAQQLLSQGIVPSTRNIIVVKSAIAWKAAYGDVARSIITVDTPGACTSNVHAIPYQVRPAMYPLEDVHYGE